MAAAIAPISYAEIEAFNRSACAALSAWDVLLIRRVDDAIRAVALVFGNRTNVGGANDVRKRTSNIGLNVFVEEPGAAVA